MEAVTASRHASTDSRANGPGILARIARICLALLHQPVQDRGSERVTHDAGDCVNARACHLYFIGHNGYPA